MTGTRADSPVSGAQHIARVLLVDDAAGDQYLVRRALMNNGGRADPLVIDHGDTALEYLRRAPSARTRTRRARISSCST